MMKRHFERITVVGTGILGSQIALLSARAGYHVTAYDARPGAFGQTVAKIKADLTAKNITPFIPFAEWEACQQKVQILTDMVAAVKEADLIIEAVPESLELKRQVWQTLGRAAAPEAILATNSSSMPVSKIEDAGGRHEHSLNIHFYFPLQGVNHVDVMGGSRTLPAVMEAGIAYVRSIGCIPLTVKKELLGFCFNRVWRAIKREVLYMWGNGFVDLRDVDRGWMVFTGMKEGPFAIMDKVGLDVVWDIEMVYYNESKDPKDHPPRALKEMIARGDLGVKTGKGFYSYPQPEYLQAGFLNP
jgi:3-hydroxybutyryl-CoA dehydrogenase